MTGGRHHYALFGDPDLLAWHCRKSEQFDASFGTEARCVEWLRRQRWPGGFTCGRCGGGGAWVAERRGYLCRSCWKFSSVTAGTILHGTRKPLRKWFEALFLMVQRGVNARVLQRELGLTYKVAWAWSHKLRSLLGPLVEGPTYGAERKRGVSSARTPAPAVEEPCGCTKLVARDWCWIDDPEDDRRPYLERILPPPLRRFDDPEEPLPRSIDAHWDLLATYSGSMSEKHLRAYLDELAFRGRRERRSVEELYLLAAPALARSEPRPYAKIVAKPEARGRALSIFRDWRELRAGRRPGGARSGER